MITIISVKGIPSSGKSTWAKAEVAKDPKHWVRINNDDLRSMCNGSVYDSSYEKLISETRSFLIKESLRKDKNIIIDNLNITPKHWDDTCAIAKAANKDITVSEKAFYIDVETAIARDVLRTGSAQVGEKVIRKWFRELNGEKFKDYVPRIEIFSKRDHALDIHVEPMKQNELAPPAIMVDLDGTLARIGNRSPYSAALCDILDTPNQHIVDVVKLHHNSGHHIIFCSGRMEKDRHPTIRFIEKCLPNMQYYLFMRRNDDTRKDDIIKKEIFDNHIRDKFHIKLILDDRLGVVRMWYMNGLPVLRVGSPDNSF